MKSYPWYFLFLISVSLIFFEQSSFAASNSVHIVTSAAEVDALPADEDFLVFSTYDKFDWSGLDYDAMVSNTATRLGLKTYVFQGQSATRAAFLKYAKSPYLVGIFYDGDGNDIWGYATGMMDANGDTITADDIKNSNFNWKNVTFLGLTCHGFTDPLLDAIKKTNVRAYISGVTTLHQHDENDELVAQCGSSAMIKLLHGGSIDSNFSFIEKCDSGDHGGDGVDKWGLYKTNVSDDTMLRPQMNFDVAFQYPNSFGSFIENKDDDLHKSGDKVDQLPHLLHMVFMDWKGTGNRPMFLYDLYRKKVLNSHLWKNSEFVIYQNGRLILPENLEPN